MQNLKLLDNEIFGVFPFLIFWQGLIICQGLSLDYVKRSDYFSWKKSLLINFYFSIAAIITIAIGYSIIMLRPLLHFEMLIVLVILTVFSSILLYRFKIYLYDKLDSFPKQPKLVTCFSVGLILLPGIVYLFIAFMIGAG